MKKCYSTNLLNYSILSLISIIFFFSCKKELEPKIKEPFKQSTALTAVSRNPLYIPPVVSPSGLTLTAAPGSADLGGGTTSIVWEYNGSMPGPTIKANTGTNASIVFHNNLPEESIIHWHGMVVNHANDGHPMQAVPQGGTYSYSFPIRQRAAFNWYHPHPHMLTGKQVFKGLAGGFIVNDAEEANFNLPSGKYEVPLIIRDALLDSRGNIKYQPSAGGMFGKIALVNGTKDPYLNVDKAVYRFRILNGANSRIFNLALSNNAPFRLIGNDGGLLPASSNQLNITMSNGERIDVLIDFRKFPQGTVVMLKDLNANWDLVEFRVTGSTPIAYNGNMWPTSTIQPLTNPVKTRTFTFDAMSKINGLEYEMNRIDWKVPLGQTERWKFKSSGGNGPHPVHIHGTSFQVISRVGGRGKVFPWERGWKDTVFLNDGETVTVLIRFDAYKGIYLMHCHKLEHEDMGMMANFRVI